MQGMVNQQRSDSYVAFTMILCTRFELSITQKMADQGRSDLDVVFTMILWATNFFIW